MVFRKKVSGKEQQGLGPPAWKQIFVGCFLGLYPLVMIRLKLFPGTGIIDGMVASWGGALWQRCLRLLF